MIVKVWNRYVQHITRDRKIGQIRELTSRIGCNGLRDVLERPVKKVIQIVKCIEACWQRNGGGRCRVRDSIERRINGDVGWNLDITEGINTSTYHSPIMATGKRLLSLSPSRFRHGPNG